MKEQTTLNKRGMRNFKCLKGEITFTRKWLRNVLISGKFKTRLKKTNNVQSEFFVSYFFVFFRIVHCIVCLM